MNKGKESAEESKEENIATGLSKEKRSTQGRISSEILDIISEKLEGKRYGYVKIIVQDSYIFAIEEQERVHLD